MTAGVVGVADVAERLRRSTVLVRGTGRAAGRGFGSGVVWRTGLVVTNAHVVNGRAQCIESPDGAVREGRVVRLDPRRDLAALAVDTAGLDRASVALRHTLRVGELLIAVGHPLGLPAAVSTGVVHGFATSRGGTPLVFADVALRPGNSGGPLGDARGRVVGVNTAVAGGVAVAIASDAVERFLEAVPLAA